jgi:PGF-pre-PGF domain-containing protein
VAPAPGGGGGAGGNPGAIDDGDDADDGSDDGTAGTLTETQSIVSSADFGLSQVRFTTDSNIVAITWDGTNISGAVTTTAYNRTPEAVAPVPGAMATVSEVTVPENLTTTPAVVEQRVARERLNEISATADDLRTYRYTNGTWTTVETEVTAETDGEIRIESEVPGFSYLAVSAVSEPTAAATVPSSVTVGEEVSLDASDSRDQYGSLTAYNWTVGGETLTGETVTTTFNEAGDVEVTLTVTNDAGETNTVTETVTVEAESDDSSGDGSDGSDGTDGSGGGETDGNIPGFTGLITVLALLGGLFIVRQMR